MNISITHTTTQGTTLTGTTPNDGSSETLKTLSWRYSRTINAWYLPRSRNTLPNTHTITATTEALTHLNFTVTTTIDDTIPTGPELAAADLNRQKHRSTGLHTKAARLEQLATHAHTKATQAYAAIPPGGEPIKIGHHSETKHRNAFTKATTARDNYLDATHQARTAHTNALNSDKNLQRHHPTPTQQPRKPRQPHHRHPQTTPIHPQPPHRPPRLLAQPPPTKHQHRPNQRLHPKHHQHRPNHPPRKHLVHRHPHKPQNHHHHHHRRLAHRKNPLLQDPRPQTTQLTHTRWLRHPRRSQRARS